MLHSCSLQYILTKRIYVPSGNPFLLVYHFINAGENKISCVKQISTVL